MVRFSMIAICGIAVLFFALSVSASVIDVPSQYATIQAGIDAGNPGDTVLVAPGLYVENVIIDSCSIVLASHYLINHNPSYIDSTIIDGDSLNTAVRFTLCDSTAMLVGFTIQGGYSSHGFGGGVDCSRASPKIMNNYIKNNYGGGIACWYGSGVIRDNIIIHNSAVYTGGGISCVFRGSIRIENNLIAYNSAGNSGGGIYCQDDTVSIINNTIYGNDGAFFGGGIKVNRGLGDNPVVTVTNTIVWQNSAQNGRQIHVTAPSITSITYCDVQGGWAGDGNIDADPLFCSPADTNFGLAENSPCIGAGYNGGNMGAFGVGCGVVGLANELVGLPEDFVLMQNYPNPFNAQTTIRFSLPEARPVTLDIYDILGRKIGTAFTGNLPAGEHGIVWDAGELSSGAYFYRLSAGGRALSGKMALMK